MPAPRTIAPLRLATAALLLAGVSGCNAWSDLTDPPPWLTAEDAPMARQIQRVERSLDKPVSLNLTDANLDELIQAIAEDMRSPILVDHAELENAGFNLRRRGDLYAYQQPARRTLEAALDLFRDEAGRPELDYRITPDGVMIGTLYSDARVPFDRHSPYAAWNLLRQTEVLAANQAGPIGAEPPTFTALRTLVHAPHGPAILSDLVYDESATLAGRLYALTGLAYLDPETFHRAAATFAERGDPVATHVGTTFEVLAVREVLTYIPLHIAPVGSLDPR